MKKLIVVVLVILTLQNWSSISNFINPLPDYAEAHGGKVILYATSWCSYCKKTRKLLEDNKIDYFEYNIENSIEGKDQHERLGGKGVPVLLIDGEVVKGYNPTRIIALAKRT